MVDPNQTYEREVKPFGDGGAHITVPSELIGHKVEITHKNWDNELGGEIHSINGYPTITSVETKHGTEYYPSPTVRTHMMSNPNTISIGLIKNSQAETPQVYSYPMSLFDSHVILHGDTGMGRIDLLTNMIWQYTNANTPNNHVFIGSTGFGMKHVRQLLTNNNIDIQYIPVKNDDMTQLDISTNSTKPTLIDLSNTSYEHRETVIKHITTHLTQTQTREHPLPLFVDEYPLPLYNTQTLQELRDANISLISTLHSIDMVEHNDSGTIQWMCENTEFITFRSALPQTWETLSNTFNINSRRISDLTRHEVILCSQNKEHIRTFPQYPHNLPTR